MHTALFCSNNVKQNRLEKQNFKIKKRMANVQMFRDEDVMWTFPGCNQITFPATMSTTGIKL